MRRLTLIALSACGMLMTGCASSLPASAPRVEMPAEARRRCSLYRLPANPTQADLETGYQMRGAAIVECDAARALAVQTHEDEHALEDRADREREARRRPWWMVWR